MVLSVSLIMKLLGTIQLLTQAGFDVKYVAIYYEISVNDFNIFSWSKWLTLAAGRKENGTVLGRWQRRRDRRQELLGVEWQLSTMRLTTAATAARRTHCTHNTSITTCSTTPLTTAARRTHCTHNTSIHHVSQRYMTNTPCSKKKETPNSWL